MSLHLHNIPARVAARGYVLHTGLERWKGSKERAEGVHAAAAGAFPFLAKAPASFLKALSVAEMSVGAALLTPIVPDNVAGAALAAFAGGLVTWYLQTPSLHSAGSIWPAQAGIAASKDVWMLGVGLALLADDGCARKA